MSQIKILLADDDATIRDLYQQILETEGYEVELAANGQEALSKLQQGGYGLVLMDIMMPKLDGIGVLKNLKQNPPANHNGPVVITSNLNDPAASEEAKELGASKVLLKSDLNPEELLQEIKSVL